MLQIGRNLTDAVDAFLLKHRYSSWTGNPLYTQTLPPDARVGVGSK